MPIICTNAQVNRFLVALRSDFHFHLDTEKEYNISIHFNGFGGRYKTHMFTDQNDFINAVFDILPKAVQPQEIRDRFTSANAKEDAMITRFVEWLRKHNMSYKPYLNNHHPIDGYVVDSIGTEHAVQLKFSNTKNVFLYEVSISKMEHGIHCPYSIKDDLEAIVIQVGTYDDNFLIIPFIAAIAEGLVSTEHQPGVTGVCVPSPVYQGIHGHWMMPYWNRADLLANPSIIHKIRGLRAIVSHYKRNGHTLSDYTGKPGARCCRVDGLKMQSFHIRSHQTKTYVSLPYRRHSLKDAIDIFVFVWDENVYPIPLDAMNSRQYITQQTSGYTISITIHKTDPWFAQFHNNLDGIFTKSDSTKCEDDQKQNVFENLEDNT